MFDLYRMFLSCVKFTKRLQTIKAYNGRFKDGPFSLATNTALSGKRWGENKAAFLHFVSLIPACFVWFTGLPSFTDLPHCNSHSCHSQCNGSWGVCPVSASLALISLDRPFNLRLREIIGSHYTAMFQRAHWAKPNPKPSPTVQFHLILELVIEDHCSLGAQSDQV